MAFRNDGGNFGDDPLMKLLAYQQKGSLSADQMNQQDKTRNDAINTGAGFAMGSIKAPPALTVAAEEAPVELSLADKIRQAAANSNVKGPEGGLTNNASMYQQGSPFQQAAQARFNMLKDAILKARGQ